MTTTERRRSAGVLAVALRAQAEKRARQLDGARAAGLQAVPCPLDALATDVTLLTEVAEMIEHHHAMLRAIETSEILDHCTAAGVELTV